LVVQETLPGTAIVPELNLEKFVSQMLKKTDTFAWMSVAARLLLAGVFVFAGVPKLFDPESFAITISAYGLLPDGLVYPAAVFLPIFEICTAVGLLLGRRWAIIATLLLYVVFISVLSYGVYLGLDIDCGCFGPEDPEHAALAGLRTALYRDLLLLVPAVYCLWYAWSRKIHYLKGEHK
jgi:uncharacterized membrane protein YphA (DoxX/SURF4 family)